MTSEETYAYLTEHLCKLLRETELPGSGARDKRIDKATEAMMCELFERYMYKEPGLEPVVMMNKSEKLMVYNGRCYEGAEPDLVPQLVKRVMAELDVSMLYQKNTYSVVAKQVLEGMHACGRSLFRPDRRYVAFNNCIYDLKGRRMLPFDRKYRTDLCFGFDYKADCTSALWEGKLAQIIPDADMRAALQMFFGCLLLDRDEIKVEYVCFILGPGGNGKSVLVDAVVNTFGRDLFAKFSPQQLFRSQQAMFNLAELDGKLANFCDDVSNTDFSGGEFKSFVSGDEFQARFPYGHTFFKVRAPWLICCANEMPPTTDDTDGFHRRILPITSAATAWTGKDKDPELPYKLRAEEVRQAIFNWVLEGYYKVVECHGRIELGNSVVEAQRELREDSNSARRWIRDMGYVPCAPDGGGEWKMLKEMYKDYRTYCDDNGEQSPRKLPTVSKLFKQLGFAYERRSDGLYFYVSVEADEGLEEKGYDKRAETMMRRKEFWTEEERKQRELEDQLPF